MGEMLERQKKGCQVKAKYLKYTASITETGNHEADSSVIFLTHGGPKVGLYPRFVVVSYWITGDGQDPKCGPAWSACTEALRVSLVSALEEAFRTFYRVRNFEEAVTIGKKRQN
ncbi:BJ4_G0016230.mRNA.1.CDS.1 [Saccharomyces cerevisiae]|nr:BJ4_G0016230.mRNA.1.CDS.1 [Saccharomyces cerevisiae]